MTDDRRPAPSRFDAVARRRFAEVEAAVARHGPALRAVPGVLGVRPGYRFHEGWITDKAAIVVTVGAKLPPESVPAGQRLPAFLDGIPVDVSPATPLEQLRAAAVAKGLAAPPLAAEDEPALPGWEREAGPGSPALAGEAKKATRPYVPPAGVDLDEVEGPMTLICQASPDAGWATLGPFLAATRHRLTVGMFDFSAPHILEGLRDAMVRADGPLKLVLDPALTLSRGKDPDSPKARDVTEEEVRDTLSRALGDRFAMAWAAVKRRSKTTGGIFASAYHIKVAVRDGEAVWLSSGNWQSSNQPDPRRLGPDPDPAAVLAAYNREWQVVAEHTGLARVFERFLENNFDQAAPLQAGAESIADRLPRLVVPVEAVEKRGLARFFEPKTFRLDATDGARVRPLLTPDNYAGHVRDLIRSARRSLYFQNQYISVARLNAGPFLDLVEALREKVNDPAIDARVILRDGGDARGMLEALKAQGFRTDRIRLQKGCHNKGIVVDEEAVLIGSHNWSSDGTTANRDASLIIRHPAVAAYFAELFRFDWENRARAWVSGDRPGGMPRLAADGGPVPKGMALAAWDDVFEDSGEEWRRALAVLRDSAQAGPAESTTTRGTGMNAHALVIGIAKYTGVRPLPEVLDAEDIAAVLRDPSACAYSASNVAVLRDGDATGANVRAALADLAARCDEDSTAFVYFSGHGGRLESGDRAVSYLLPVDAVWPADADLARTGIAASEFNGALNAIPARKLLVILDCCHAGGLGETKGAVAGAGLTAGPSEADLEVLKAGRGRAILASSRTTEVSYARTGGPHSVFTRHLLDGLRGGAPGPGGAIRVCDLFDYVQRAVSRDEPRQHSVFKAELEENFPVALHRGGARPAPSPAPAPLADGYVYDVFLNYSKDRDADRTWVRKALYPRLKAEGLKVCLDTTCFKLGVPLINEMERAVQQSRYTLAVLTPAYLASNFVEFEGILARHLGLEKSQSRFIGLLREPCTPSLGVRALYYLDMTQDDDFDLAVEGLVAQLREPPDRRAAAS